MRTWIIVLNNLMTASSDETHWPSFLSRDSWSSWQTPLSLEEEEKDEEEEEEQK